jgi:hypothetical protein
MKAIGRECMDCIIMVQEKEWWGALVSTVMKHSDSTVCGKFLGSMGTISFFKRDFCIELICTHKVLFILSYVRACE